MSLLALVKNTHLGNEDEAGDAASDEQQSGQRLRGKVSINSKICKWIYWESVTDVLAWDATNRSRVVF
jgi:hypothetical protein